MPISNAFQWVKATLLTQRFGHALKTGLAILIGILLARLSGLQNEQWVLITIIVVMSSQINVGSLVQRSLMRLGGTCAGALVALLTIYFLPVSQTELLVVAVISSIGFVWLAGSPGSLSYVGTLGAATVMIILMGGHVSIELAESRVFEIIMGVLISLAVSMMVFPVRAGHLLVDNMVEIFRKLAVLYQTALLPESNPADLGSFPSIEDAIRKLLATHERLIREARREPPGAAVPLSVMLTLDPYMRKIFRGILQMHYICLMFSYSGMRFFNTADVSAFHAKTGHALNAICRMLQKLPLEPSKSTTSFPTIWEEMPIDEESASDEEKRILHALIIAARLVTDNIYACQKILIEKILSL